MCRSVLRTDLVLNVSDSAIGRAGLVATSSTVPSDILAAVKVIVIA